ncbi:hypothetical protein PR048_004600 [Dryococelus australis]|uniref:Uncharacterized protein n=1 Tax=Dryococelus australis TaxID=614101 RepID=A0ABQ9I5X4_9NEOP|nr:hypothetical protein PR048_004600 [Dryococelus australis]
MLRTPRPLSLTARALPESMNSRNGLDTVARGDPSTCSEIECPEDLTTTQYQTCLALIQEPRWNSGRIALGFSFVGIVPDDTAGRRVFSVISRFPRPCIPASLQTHLASPSSALKTSMLSTTQTFPQHSTAVTPASIGCSRVLWQRARGDGRRTADGVARSLETPAVRKEVARPPALVISPHLNPRCVLARGRKIYSHNSPFLLEAAVAERLGCSPPTKAIQVQSPAGSQDFRMWESCRGSPVSLPFHSGAAPYLNHSHRLSRPLKSLHSSLLSPFVSIPRRRAVFRCKWVFISARGEQKYLSEAPRAKDNFPTVSVRPLLTVRTRSLRNHIIRKLTNSTWGAQPNVLRISASALMQNTRPLFGAAQLTPKRLTDIRQRSIAENEKMKQESDSRHPMFGYVPPQPRLRSRKSFLQTTKLIPSSLKNRRKTLWRNSLTGDLCEHIKEAPAAGYHLLYATWKALNRLRTGVSRCKVNLKKAGYITGDKLCECGEHQNPQHLLVYKNLKDPCTIEDLYAANDKAVQTVEFWLWRRKRVLVQVKFAVVMAQSEVSRKPLTTSMTHCHARAVRRGEIIPNAVRPSEFAKSRMPDAIVIPALRAKQTRCPWHTVVMLRGEEAESMNDRALLPGFDPRFLNTETAVGSCVLTQSHHRFDTRARRDGDFQQGVLE